MVHDGFHTMPVMFVLHGAEGLILNPEKDHHPKPGLSPRRSHPCPPTDLQQLRTSCNVLMASLHCSVQALSNWIDWRFSLNSQSYCGCQPVFIFLSSSLIKSPAVGLGKINQHFSIHSCFHEVLSITSNIYFIMLLFTLLVYKTQCWGREHQPVSECKQLKGLQVQVVVLDLYL